jgi:hypothetical protein
MLSASRRSRIRLAMYLSIAVAPLGGEVDLDFAFFISALTVDALEKAIPVTSDVPLKRKPSESGFSATSFAVPARVVSIAPDIDIGKVHRRISCAWAMSDLPQHLPALIW